MKRIIKSNTQLYEGYPDSKYVYNQDKNFFDTYCTELFARDLFETDRRKVASIRVYLKVRNRKIEVKRKCPLSEEQILELIEQLKIKIFEYIDSVTDIEEKRKQIKNELSKDNKKIMSPISYTNKVVYDRLGVKPTVVDSSGSRYMLWSLPFTENGDIIMSKYEEFKESFLSILEELDKNYRFNFFNVSTPSGGNRHRAAFRFDVWGPDVVVDKTTGEAEIFEGE